MSHGTVSGAHRNLSAFSNSQIHRMRARTCFVCRLHWPEAPGRGANGSRKRATAGGRVRTETCPLFKIVRTIECAAALILPTFYLGVKRRQGGVDGSRKRVTASDGVRTETRPLFVSGMLASRWVRNRNHSRRLPLRRAVRVTSATAFPFARRAHIE